MVGFFRIFAGTIALAALASCHSAIKPGALYGKWKYVKVENPRSNPPDSVSAIELQIESPYIRFSKNDSMMIWWGNRVLAHGTYKLDGDNIRIKEILDSGKTRSYPFYISKLTAKDLVFETTGDNGTKVTAVKE